MAIGTGAALLGSGLLSGVLGASNASSANRAAAEAAKPQPFSRNETRSPWEPTRGALEEAVEMARGLYDRNRQAPGPPQMSTGGITGASPRLRELANAMYGRAMGSSFIPDMQDRLSSFMEGPNPMMQQVFGRSMNYQNPMLEMLTQRGLGGPGSFDTGSSQIQDLISGLMGGQQQLGQPPPPGLPPAAVPPQFGGGMPLPASQMAPPGGAYPAPPMGAPPPQMMAPPPTPQPGQFPGIPLK